MPSSVIFPYLTAGIRTFTEASSLAPALFGVDRFISHDINRKSAGLASPDESYSPTFRREAYLPNENAFHDISKAIGNEHFQK